MVPAKNVPAAQTASSGRSVDQELPRLLDRLMTLLAHRGESVRDYRRKKLIDLSTTPSLWIAGGVLALILLFWRLYRKEIRDLVGNLQTLKIGDSLQFVRATVEEMRSFGEGDPEFENPAQQVVGAPIENFFSFLRYPANKLANTLDDPFISMNWPPLPWLRNLEASLSIQAERLKASQHFREDHPPPDFIEAKKRLFRALVSLGNYYGFVKREDGANQRVDLESSLYFLRRAVDLRPEADERPQLTVGYAQFCMGAVSGTSGIDLTDQATQNPQGLVPAAVEALRVQGEDLMERGIALLDRAANSGHQVPSQYHLKAYMLFRLKRADEAAEAWLVAASISRPPSAKMYYNRACALATIAKYGDSLTALDQAIQIVASRGIAAAGFDPRVEARDPVEGAELAPFWTGVAEAVAARSARGRSFNDLVT